MNRRILNRKVNSKFIKAKSKIKKKLNKYRIYLYKL